MKKYYKAIILLICLIAILAIVVDLFQKEIIVKDMAVYNFIEKHFISDYSLPIVKFITNLGSATYVKITSIIL